MAKKVSLAQIKQLIPNYCFKKSLSTSILYMVRDFLLLSTAFWMHKHLPLILFWNIYGFIMWCIFVVGHDCGHGSFSHYPLINDICGHICHTILLVPYWPWRYSHWKHHLHHNHHTKDHSHPWWTLEEYYSDTTFNQKVYRSPIMPFVAYIMNLYLGYFDGSHIIPTSMLYKNAKTEEKLKCIFSTMVIVTFLWIIFVYFSVDIYTFTVYYGGCWIVFGFWLFMVTYLQHHSENGSIIFEDDTWNFVDGALQTIDRCYGYGIDNFHHNISDCHVIHHLFFTKIPHYHLKAATDAIKPYLMSKGKYKHKKHQFVWKDFWMIFFTHNFIGTVHVQSE
eukprot:324031_1